MSYPDWAEGLVNMINEFDNQEFRDMAQNLNVVVRMAVSQSHRSDGLYEHCNTILEDLAPKTMVDIQYDFIVFMSLPFVDQEKKLSKKGF